MMIGISEAAFRNPALMASAGEIGASGLYEPLDAGLPELADAVPEPAALAELATGVLPAALPLADAAEAEAPPALAGDPLAGRLVLAEADPAAALAEVGADDAGAPADEGGADEAAGCAEPHAASSTMDAVIRLEITPGKGGMRNRLFPCRERKSGQIIPGWPRCRIPMVSVCLTETQPSTPVWS